MRAYSGSGLHLRTTMQDEALFEEIEPDEIEKGPSTCHCSSPRAIIQIRASSNI